MHADSRPFRLLLALIPALLCAVATAAELEQAEPNPEAEQAADAAQLPDGFTMDLFASEPLLANPVAIDVDEHNRVYVVETFRLGQGVTDNRQSAFWLEDDLAAQTLEDRLDYQLKWVERGERSEEWYTENSDRLRLVIDEDDDGKADHSHVFADDFDSPLHGIAAGVLAFGQDVYFANIPHMYRLPKNDAGTEAADRDVLHRGYGVRTAFIGHDLHGLTLGPDGKIYFSIGDRGYNIEQPDGSRLVDPLDAGRGAVFRCNLDGSELEVFYTGLRNPQDLAFDRYGNLFTGDNNADGRDRARIVYLIEGGDSGWSMNFQSMQDRGPWERERLWETANDDRPAWALPPLDYLSAGPSGLEYNPGLAGLPERYDDYFFMADFRGNAANSGIHAFTLEPDGAGFTVEDPHQFIWNVLATDLKFGYDGQIYISDWDNGWGIRQPPVGRIHTARHESAADDTAIAEMTDLVREDFSAMASDKLADLLGHADMRIRLRAQYALAERIDTADAADPVQQIAADDSFLPARLHAVWALGQVLRAGNTFVLDALLKRLDDEDPHVRAQAAKVIGDAAAHAEAGPAVKEQLDDEAVARLIDRLADDSAHVRALTAIALGKVGDKQAFEPLLQLLHENANEDQFLRHAAVMGIFGTSDADTLVQRAESASAPQRMGIVLALRRHEDPRLAQFLDDVESPIIREAATAIYDLNIAEAMPALAALLDRYTRQPSQAEQQPTFKREFYDEIPGGSIDDLRNADKFPDAPDAVDHATALATPADRADEYGSRLTGQVTPEQSGEYVFMVAGDDKAELYLSTDESAGNKTLIASAPEYTQPQEYDKNEQQTSDPIELEAGRSYYIEVLHKEGGGQDHVSVAWRNPDGEVESPIGGGTDGAPTPLLRRVINANLAIGGEAEAERVARYAADATQPSVLRQEALAVLGTWAEPSPRDRVLNYIRPLPERDEQIARAALEPLMVTIVDNSAGNLQSQATELATDLSLALDEEAMMERLRDADQPAEARLAALRSLVGSNSPRAREAIGEALEADSPRLRAEGRRLLAQRDPSAGLTALREALDDGELIEQQHALAALGELEHDGADALLADQLDDLLAGNVRRALQLDLIEAARQRRNADVDERLAAYEQSLSQGEPLAAYQVVRRGGDAEAGRNVFFSHPAAQCIRCHTIDGVGGDAGPDLTGVGERRSRQQLIADLVTPNEDIAEGFGTVVLTLEDGQVIAGTLREEAEDTLTVVTPDGQVQQVSADDVASQTPAVSAMPPMGDILTSHELRDLIEFLATHEGDAE